MNDKPREFIFGKNPVFESLRGGREVHEIYGTHESIKWLLRKCEQNGIKIRAKISTADKNQLYRLVKRKDHQGLVALVSQFEYTPLRLILRRKPDIMVMPVGITDPQNLGAIIRTSELLGVGAILIPKKNSAKITPVVAHTSAGAVEHMPIAIVESPAHTIESLKREGYKVIACEKPSAKSILLPEFEPPSKTLLLFGSEGEGLPLSIVKRADLVVSIPQKGIIDSFNVSAAAAIIIYHICSQAIKIKNSHSN